MFSLFAKDSAVVNGIVVPKTAHTGDRARGSAGAGVHAAREVFIPALQALRGIAAFGVVVYHAEIFLREAGGTMGLPGVRFGWLGVDLFFVLSAFVLTRALQGAEAPRYRDFLADRLLRLLPAYYATVVITGLAVLSFDPAAFRPLGFIANLTFIQNFRDEWNLALTPTFWTLAVELQFYLLLPLLLSGRCEVRRVAWLAAVALVGAVIFRASCYARGFVLPSAMSLPAFAGHFVLGVLAARIGTVARPGLWLAGALPFFIVPPLLGIPGGSTGFGSESLAGATFVRPFVAIGCFGIVLASASPGWWRSALERPLWLWLGRISFSLYLIHALVLAKTVAVLDSLGLPAKDHPLIYATVGVGISLLAGKALYGVVEAPADAWRRARKIRRPAPLQAPHCPAGRPIVT
jgi:peptidoglycan/LPS O-acetylase OafA/YrhL